MEITAETQLSAIIRGESGGDVDGRTAAGRVCRFRWTVQDLLSRPLGQRWEEVYGESVGGKLRQLVTHLERHFDDEQIRQWREERCSTLLRNEKERKQQDEERALAREQTLIARKEAAYVFEQRLAEALIDLGQAVHDYGFAALLTDTAKETLQFVNTLRLVS